MPFPITTENANQWHEANILKQGPFSEGMLEVDDLLIQYEIAAGEEAIDALARLRMRERRLYRQIQAIENRLNESPNVKLDRRLAVKRKQWIEASNSATAVWRVLKSMDAGNELQEALGAADKYISLVLE